MYRFFILFISLGISSSVYSKTAKKDIPPGTVEVRENFFIDITEITNFNWLEYLNWNQMSYGKESKAYRNTLPDTTVWGENDTLFTKKYLRHPAFRNYPVIGVSYQQALAFSQWRSDRVNEYYFAKENKEAYTRYKENPSSVTIPEIFQYRLPTLKEWEETAEIGYSKKAERKRTSQGELSNMAGSEDQTTRTAKVFQGFSNLIGVFNLIGNVSEMTATNGKAKGGSWIHTLKEAQAIQSYTQPTNWLGFRCVCNRLK